MLRFFFRVIGLLSLVGGFAAAVMDAARSLADQRLELTPSGVTLAALFPVKFAELPALAAKIHPKLWDPVLLSIFYVPTFFCLTIIGVVLMIAIRPRRPPDEIGARR